jgi:glycosyltransferase involved in cell wall biosynthesis
LIQGYYNLSCWLAFFAAKLAGIKVIWRGESTLKGDENSASLKKRLKQIVLTKLFKACDAVMYSCTGNKDYLKFYGVHESKLFPIPCAVDNDYFRTEYKKYLEREKDIRKELGIKEDDFVILFSARFTTRKRPLDLLKAIRKIEHDNILVLFVGDGLERRNMEKYVQNHRIRALFTGFQNQSEISKYYSVSDMAIVASDYDPSPKAMNEAMNFELPIIITDVVGTAYDLVEDGENGFVVKVGDVDTIAEKIDYLNKNRTVAKVMGKKSWEIIKDWNFQKDAKSVERAVKFVNNK